MKKTKVNFEFINEKKELKKVVFYMDEKYYKDLFHPSISEEIRNECLLAEYRMSCKDDKYKRRHVGFEVDEEGFIIEKQDKNQLSPEEVFYLTESKKEQFEKIKSYISQVKSLKQQKALTCFLINGLKNKEAAKIMKISESSYCELLKRAVNSLKEQIFLEK